MKYVELLGSNNVDITEIAMTSIQRIGASGISARNVTLHKLLFFGHFVGV